MNLCYGCGFSNFILLIYCCILNILRSVKISYQLIPSDNLMQSDKYVKERKKE
jgi:hypothetical protein